MLSFTLFFNMFFSSDPFFKNVSTDYYHDVTDYFHGFMAQHVEKHLHVFLI